NSTRSPRRMAWRLLRAWKLRTPSHMVPPSATSWSKEYFVGSCLTSQYPRPIASGRLPNQSAASKRPAAPATADAHGDDAPALPPGLETRLYPTDQISAPVANRACRESHEAGTRAVPSPPLEGPLGNTEKKRRRLSFTDESVVSSVVGSTH